MIRMANPNTMKRPSSQTVGGFPRQSVVFVCIGCLLAGLATGCGKQQKVQERPALPTALVRVAPAGSGTHTAFEEVVGSVRAKQRATVEAKVSGRIARLNATLGKTVTAGEVVCELDVREIKARLDQAVAQSQQAARDLERFSNLLKQEAVTRAEYDATEARSRIAAAAVAEAETMLGYAQVTAPFAGVVTRKLADVGELAAPGRPLLEIENPADLRVEVDVPEALLRRVNLGAKLQVRYDETIKPVEAIVSEIAPGADQNSRTYRVKLDLPTDSSLRSGQFVRVAIPLGETTSVVVPTSAVLTRGQLELAFVVTNNQARLRLVRTAKRLGDMVEIVSGINVGENVVTEGTAALLDGQPVQVR